MKKINWNKEFERLFNNFADYDFEFEKVAINNEFVSLIRKLMIKNKINKKELAKKLKITNQNLENLFSSDELFDITLIAKPQRIFNTKLIITTNEKTKKN